MDFIPREYCNRSEFEKKAADRLSHLENAKNRLSELENQTQKERYIQYVNCKKEKIKTCKTKIRQLRKQQAVVEKMLLRLLYKKEQTDVIIKIIKGLHEQRSNIKNEIMYETERKTALENMGEGEWYEDYIIKLKYDINKNITWTNEEKKATAELKEFDEIIRGL